MFTGRFVAALLISCTAAISSMRATAQTGPLEPRFVMAGAPTMAAPPIKEGTTSLPLELELAADGRVVDVKILKSSGDPKFDERVRKYYKRFRMIPTVTEAGLPIESTYSFIYRSTTLPTPIPLVNPAQPPPTTMTQAGPGAPRVFDEVGRINRMRCKDFLWEFDLMKDIAGARPVYDERMMRTSVAMFIVEEKVSGAAIAALNRVFPATVRDAAKQCRDKPDEKYFQNVLAPALKAALAQ